jgi:hypothetical protein
MAKKDSIERDETESQKQMREYHEGEFQKKDPITGESRDLDGEAPVARVDRGEYLDEEGKVQS